MTQVGLSVASARQRERARDPHEPGGHAPTVRGGVLTDEEVISLIEFQQAYTAATRLVTVADEMMQSILQMV